jgi:hypothetical protein
MAKRRCTQKTKAGKRCRAWPLHGSDVCMAHSDEKTRESVGFIAANGKAGRPRLPTPTEVARRLIEDNIAAVLRPHFRTLGYEVEIANQELRLAESAAGGAKVYGESREGEIKVSSYDDLGAMIAAAEKLLDRVYGRPTQHTHGKLEVVDQMDREIERLLDQLSSNGDRPRTPTAV